MHTIVTFFHHEIANLWFKKYPVFIAILLLIFVLSKLVFELFICMNLCHSLIVEEHDGKKIYSGTSSDEECIMEFCVA